MGAGPAAVHRGMSDAPSAGVPTCPGPCSPGRRASISPARVTEPGALTRRTPRRCPCPKVLRLLRHPYAGGSCRHSRVLAGCVQPSGTILLTPVLSPRGYRSGNACTRPCVAMVSMVSPFGHAAVVFHPGTRCGQPGASQTAGAGSRKTAGGAGCPDATAWYVWVLSHPAAASCVLWLGNRRTGPARRQWLGDAGHPRRHMDVVEEPLGYVGYRCWSRVPEGYRQQIFAGCREKQPGS